MKESRGKGYVGKSMSVNAKNAYINEEKPLSKWTKKEILETLEENDIEVSSIFKKLPTKVLHDNFLKYTSYHHTGMLFNETEFYELDIEAIANATPEALKTLNDEHKEYLEATKAERKEEQEKLAKERAIKRSEKEFESYIKSFRSVTKYKTENTLWKAFEDKRITENELIGLKEKAIDLEVERLSKIWASNPKTQHMLDRLTNREEIYQLYVCKQENYFNQKQTNRIKR